MSIDSISDTARWVAVYRAMETERKDAIFRDPFARKLAGAKGEQIAEEIASGGQVAWSVIVRTAVFDELIVRSIKNGADTVINLAAGLDTRPWRLTLPSTLRWVDVDLPQILQYKTDTLANEKPTCEYEAVQADLTDAGIRNALFDRLASQTKKALVVTEGLLIYLTEPQVADLAGALHQHQSFAHWLFDLASPRLLVMMRKSWGKNVLRGNAEFQFGPQAGVEFFRPFGWREVEFRSSMTEAHRLKREMRMMWFWRAINKLSPKDQRAQFERMYGIVLLERIST